MRKIGIAILTAAVASVTFVQAYVIDPQGLRWFGARATFTSYFDTADAQRAVAEAVRSWQSPLEDAVDLQAVAGSGSAAIGNSTSELGWESLPPEVVSLTRIVSRSGRIIEADVSVARDAASRGPWSLDAIVSHEMGHTLGLGHADEGGITVQSAVMAANPSNTSATITRDDIGRRKQNVSTQRCVFARLPGGVSTLDVSFPPRNEPFDFRLRLETQYQSGCAAVRSRASSTSKAPSSGRRSISAIASTDAASGRTSLTVTAQILGRACSRSVATSPARR